MLALILILRSHAMIEDKEKPPSATLLDNFISTARSANAIEDVVVECGLEQWTYGDLDNVSTGLAVELHKKYGLHPLVVTLSENHPYLLAILLATWKLGGIFAPLDSHAPPSMMERMLQNIKPTFAIVPEGEKLVMEFVQGTYTLLNTSIILSLTFP